MNLPLYVTLTSKLSEYACAFTVLCPPAILLYTTYLVVNDEDVRITESLTMDVLAVPSPHTCVQPESVYKLYVKLSPPDTILRAENEPSPAVIWRLYVAVFPTAPLHVTAIVPLVSALCPPSGL